jgi:hypothetical protein
VADEELPEVKFAEHPQRTCREPQAPDGLIYHWCSLAELHPGPHCPKTLPEAIRRRAQWESDHAGWERMQRDSDPFADFTKIPGVT